jgi:integrase/recombinase XerC
VRAPLALNADIERFLGALQHRSIHTRAAYRRDLTDFANAAIQDDITNWQQVDAQRIRHYIAARHRDGAHGRSLSRALSALRALFRFLCERGVMTANPAQSIRAPKSARHLPRALDVDQMTSLIEQGGDSILDLRDRAMWELLYSSGVRVSELTGLNLGDTDLNAREARVIGKGRRERIVPIGRLAIQALKEWLKSRGNLAAADEKALFVGRRGQRLSNRSVQLRLRAWANRYGINEGVHPHMLRHSFASHMLESSGDLRAVQELLGHANISTTQIYTHLDFQHLAKVYDAAHPRAKRRSD